MDKHINFKNSKFENGKQKMHRQSELTEVNFHALLACILQKVYH